MPVQFFTEGDDSYTVSSSGDYSLVFLGGQDKLTVSGGTTVTAAMGENEDLISLKVGAPAATTVYGESGADRFDIWASGITAYGGSGGDMFNLRAGGGQTIFGESGDDRINFYSAVTAVNIDGGSGNDDFFGYGHSIGGNIYGGSGNEYFVGFIGQGGGIIHGGVGNDVYRVDPLDPATFQENLGEGIDSVQLARGDSYVLPDDIENISVQGFSGSVLTAATLTGNDINNHIVAHNNNETINGLGGDDNISSKGGDDTVNGGEGNDYIDGGTGNDTLNGDAGNDTLQGRTGDDTMSGGIGDDTYFVDSVSDQVIENSGEGTDLVRTSVDYTLGANIENAYVSGSAGLSVTGNGLDNLLVGGAGDDHIVGLDGADTIKGGAGDDVLDGGNGNDVVIGSSGSDTVAGGAGNDSFYYLAVTDSAPESYDTITDFYSLDGDGTDDDQIDLSAIDADVNTAGDQAFSSTITEVPAANALWFSAVDNLDGTQDVTFYGDTDGDTATIEFELHVHSLTGIIYFEDLSL